MPQRSRLAELWLIAAVFGVVSATLWGAGRFFDEPILSFAGLMTIASTFLPMPADAYAVNVSQYISPVTVGLLGGAINAVAVLGERMFLDRLIDYPIFAKLKRFVGTNRWIDVFEKHMFFGLIVAAASPLPFEVFRFVACARNYNRWRYGTATFIGRGGRYYVLAAAGGALAESGLLSRFVAALVGLFALGVIHAIVRFRRARGHEQGVVEST
jgi:membrane protein YqaA with SNARE-associated domain